MTITPLDAVHEARRANLRLLAAKHEGQKALADKLGYNASYLSHLIGCNSTRAISEKAARKIESRLTLQSGWLDVTRVPA